LAPIDFPVLGQWLHHYISHFTMRQEFDPLYDYARRHSTPPSALLQELERETHLKTLAPQMMSGHLQGMLLQHLSRWIQPRCVLEIGTFTGYASICLAAGLQPYGVLHTIEVNDELAWLSGKYFAKAGLSERIQAHTGDAAAILPDLDGPFDLAFIDAGKHDYARHYALIIDKVSPGGIILADNVLWSGKVAAAKMDKETRQLHDFNQMIHQDERVENLLLPLRDGLLILRKR